MRERMHALVRAAQDEICAALARLDGTRFREDSWDRPGGGGGRTRVLQDGQVFEKAGVAVSAVYGELSAEAAGAMRGKKGGAASRRFWATGLSLVLHPHNPMAPTMHANFRYFERGDGTAPGDWWFGGGSDLSPSYLFPDDATHFHRTWKATCDRHDPAYYPRFKRWCDDYFFLAHRGERRGLGGIFFDDLADRDRETLFAFVKDATATILPAYLPILVRRHAMPFGEAHKRWQGLRRGRYVEFNLIYDRGTGFGLRTGGRVESVLMSLPLAARWEYDHVPAPDSPEAELLAVLRTPRDWA